MRESVGLYVGLVLATSGCLLSIVAFWAPAPESRIRARVSALDDVMPAWQFQEFHRRQIAAPPDAIYTAIRQIRADDILLFRTLTWIRRGGRPLPPGILNAGPDRPIMDVALDGGFVLLADEPAREVVIGAIVGAPTLPAPKPTIETFRHPPPGHSVAAMNFRIVTDGRGGSLVSTETRVFSNGDDARRRFAKYWRVIYPGSSLIRYMWLRAIDRRVRRLAMPPE
jgi:hypothetical protein